MTELDLETIIQKIQLVGTSGLDGDGYIKHKGYAADLGAYAAFSRTKAGQLIPLGRTLARTPAEACSVLLSFPKTKNLVIEHCLETFTLRSTEHILISWAIKIPVRIRISWRG